jgi:hypothetical protein
LISKRQKIAAFVVVVLVVITGFVYLTLPSPETPAQAMILKASDIGSGWLNGSEGLGFISSYSGERSHYERTFVMQNSTIEFDVRLWTFDSNASCRTVFEQRSSYFQGVWSGDNYSFVPVGNRAAYVEIGGNSSSPAYMFMSGTAFGWVDFLDNHTNMVSTNDQWWVKSTMLNIVELQLNKIDQQLGS